MKKCIQGLKNRRKFISRNNQRMGGNDYTSSAGTWVMDADDLVEGKKSTWLQATWCEENS